VRTVTAPEPISGWDLLDHPSTPRTTWSITDKLAIELTQHLELHRPTRILEIGSGYSTAILGAYAARHGAEVVSLEHSLLYAGRTKRGLEDLGLAGSVDLRYAPLSRQKFANGQRYLWYNVDLEGAFDFVFVDGPPKEHGRWGVFFEVADYLMPGWELWMDDGKRAHEQKCIRLWEKHSTFSHDRKDVDGKGVWILRDGHHRDDQFEQGDKIRPGILGIGILANGDPGWWQRTRKLVDPRLLATSPIVAATDDPTAVPEVVQKHIKRGGTAVERLARRSRELIGWSSDGPPKWTVGRLLHSAARSSGVEYVLLLNDDWTLQTLDPGWLKRSLDYLESHSAVDQVFLPHRLHARSGAKLTAAHGIGFIELGAEQCCDEPSLIRARCLSIGGWRRQSRPRGLRSRMAIAVRLPPKVRTVQLSPGVFVKNGVKGKRH
jgi:hypothetical protein